MPTHDLYIAECRGLGFVGSKLIIRNHIRFFLHIIFLVIGPYLCPLRDIKITRIHCDRWARWLVFFFVVGDSTMEVFNW